MFRKIIMFAITSGLAARAYKAAKDVTRQRGPRVGRHTPEAVSVWEEEGGSTPHAAGSGPRAQPTMR